MALPWFEGSARREELRALFLLAPLQLCTHGYSPGIVLFFSHILSEVRA